ncbi:MAG: hypothetical protein K2Q26_15405 [Bdellovibrionales bacterium]|nr:hypothetical protein [Bdellovibrionales bacterium]
MAEIVYILCALMSTACAIMLFMGYKRTPTILLLWSCCCFGFLAISNTILFIDLILLPNTDFQGPMWRNVCSAAGGMLLLFGLIWEVT